MQLQHLLRTKLRILYHFFSEVTLSNIVKHLGSAVVFGSFAVGSFYFSQAIIAYLLEQAHVGLFLLHRFFSMLLFVLFVSVNIGNVVVAYAAFYRSQETEFLFTKPVSDITIFLIKFLENFFYSSTTLFIIAASFLAGYATYFTLSWDFYLRGLLLLFLPYMSIAACLAVVGLMLAMKLAARIGVWKLIAGFSLGYAGVMYYFFYFTNPIQLVTAVLQQYPNVDGYYPYLDPPIARYLPSHWIAESFYWTVKGDSSSALFYTLLLDGVAIAAFVVMLSFAKKLFHSTWLISLEMRSSVHLKATSMRRLSLVRPSRGDSQVSVLLRKEYWQFIREPSQWIHLGVIVLLVAAFLLSVSELELKTPQPLYRTMSYLAILIFNAFLVASIALRFVYPMVNLEGEAFWAVLSSPISRKKIYHVKLSLALIVISAVSIVLSLYSHRSADGHAELLIVSTLLLIAVSCTFVSLNLAAGAFFTDFREKNPIKIASSQSATLTFLISMIYLMLLVALIMMPFDKYFSHHLKGTSYRHEILWYVTFTFACLSGFTSLVATMTGRRTLEKDF